MNHPTFFLSSEIHLFDGSSKFSGRGRKVLNIFQGEIASAISSQADVLISTKATTCHIVAVRSVSLGSKSGNGKSSPLSSLCHIDKAGYENCLREMIIEHKQKKASENYVSGSESKKSSIPFVDVPTFLQSDTISRSDCTVLAKLPPAHQSFASKNPKTLT